jgi:peptidoglycan/xylan/chitin deacetylase (PgdA/CDA1 family)
MKELVTHVAVRAAHSPLASGALSLLERSKKHAQGSLRVLTYHRVAPPAVRPWLYPRIAVTPDAFEAQMRFVARHYEVLSTAEVLTLWRQRAGLPPRALLITFDDAYCDFAEYAWPILQSYRLPVTLFVPTAFPHGEEGGFWWDRLYHAVTTTARRIPLTTPAGILPLDSPAARSRAFSVLRDLVKSQPHTAAMAWVAELCDDLGVPPHPPAVLAWDALRRLAAAGVTRGAHTRTHPLLNRLPAPAVTAEIAGSLQDLQREIGAVLPILAYPSGGFDAAVAAAAATAGIALAFTTENGVNHWQRLDPLCLRRINVGWRTPLPLLRARLLA